MAPVFHPVDPGLLLRVTRKMTPLSPALAKAVDDIWNSEQARLGGRLFNGQVFSADTITPGLISGHWTEFRRVVAQMRQPELYDALRVRPLSVGGVIIGPDGVVFGRRPRHSVYQSGQWQMPPAGSIDLTAARPDGAVDFRAMLLTELAEEIGLIEAEVTVGPALGVVEHPGSRVHDLGIALTTQLGEHQILERHAALGNGEYDPLVVIRPQALAAFLRKPDVTLQAPLFLAAARLSGLGLDEGTALDPPEA